MEGYDAATYGERIADVYDDTFAPGADIDAAVGLLEELAGGGPALELGIGTGRVAVPLAGRGVPVEGIDASPAMIARLRAKPGGEEIAVTVGDFADVAVDGRYRLVYVVFNTFFALLTQEDQIRCVANVAGHLAGDGVFVIEAFVPDLTLFDRGQRVSATDVGIGQVRMDVARLDASRQRIDASHVVLSTGGVSLHPLALRYAWPSELDLMARLAGLRLRDRWAGWRREPFGPDSGSHISVYGR